MIDIVLCYVPKRFPDAPPLSLGLLKAIVEQKGYKCKVIDFNHKPVEELENWVSEVISLNPKWVGVSAMSTDSGRVALRFISSIKKKAPHIKIMVGESVVDIYFKTGNFFLNPFSFIDTYVFIINIVEIT